MPAQKFSCTAKFRYRQQDIPVQVEVLPNNQALVSFATKVKAITPGQEAVFYDGEVCLGGGIINEAYLNGQKLWYL